MHLKILAVVMPLLIISVVAGSVAADESATEEPEGNKIGSFNIDVGWASAYVFRGLNVFADTNHRDPHMLIAPGVEWDVANTGLTLGYWGAYQISGDNIQEKLDAGAGAEQDIYLSYEFSIMDILSARASVTYLFYPAANVKETGLKVPMYFEPAIGATIKFLLDWNLDVAFFTGLQDQTRPFGYVYFNPSISKEGKILPILGLFGKAGYGFKVWHDEYPYGSQNTHDLLLSAGVNIYLGKFYISPAINLTWTNLEEDKPYSYVEGTDGVVFWGSVNLGVTI